MMRRKICILLAVLCLLPSFTTAVAQTDLTWDDFADIVSTYSVNPEIPPYREYRNQYPAHRPDVEIVIEASEFVRYEEDGLAAAPEHFSDFEGMPGVSVLTGETALIEFDVQISEAGFYEISFDYYPVEGKSSSVQRSVFINGALPYRELALIELSRIWQNRQVREQHGSGSIVWEKDNQGNDLKPNMYESPDWITAHA